MRPQHLAQHEELVPQVPDLLLRLLHGPPPLPRLAIFPPPLLLVQSGEAAGEVSAEEAGEGQVAKGALKHHRRACEKEEMGCCSIVVPVDEPLGPRTVGVILALVSMVGAYEEKNNKLKIMWKLGCET